MPVKYLLECSCGNKIPVVASQAGQSVTCSCGQVLDVPTLMKLKQLETIEDAPNRGSSLSNPDVPSNWGIAQGLITIGLLITIASLIWLVYVITKKPPAPKEIFKTEIIEQRIDDMTLLETLHVWSGLQQNIRQKMPIDRQYLAAMKVYHIRLGVAIVLVVAGVCLTLMTFIFARLAMSRARVRQSQ